MDGYNVEPGPPWLTGWCTRCTPRLHIIVCESSSRSLRIAHKRTNQPTRLHNSSIKMDNVYTTEMPSYSRLKHSIPKYYIDERVGMLPDRVTQVTQEPIHHTSSFRAKIPIELIHNQNAQTWDKLQWRSSFIPDGLCHGFESLDGVLGAQVPHDILRNRVHRLSDDGRIRPIASTTPSAHGKRDPCELCYIERCIYMFKNFNVSFFSIFVGEK